MWCKEECVADVRCREHLAHTPTSFNTKEKRDWVSQKCQISKPISRTAKRMLGGHVCTYLNAFLMVNPNMKLLKWNSTILNYILCVCVGGGGGVTLSPMSRPCTCPAIWNVISNILLYSPIHRSWILAKYVAQMFWKIYWISDIYYLGKWYVYGPIKMMHMSDPTCSLFGEVGI